MKIKEVCSFNPPTSLDENMEFLYLDTGNITENRYGKIQSYTNKKALPSRAKRGVKNNDILFSTVRPNQLHYGIVKNPPANLLVSTGFAVIRPNSDILDYRYLYYWLTRKRIINYLQRIAEGSVSAYPSISPNDIGNLEIALPTLDKQNFIVSKIEPIDQQIENNYSMMKNIEEYVKLLFHKWFVNFNFPNENGNPYKDSNGEMIIIDGRKIPKDWNISKLESIAKLNLTKSNFRTSGQDSFYIGLEHMPKGSIALNEWENSDKVISDKYDFKKWDILFGKLRPYFKKVGIAPIDGVCSTDILVLSPIREEFYSYLISIVSKDEFIDYCTLTATGTRMKRSGWSQMSEYKIIQPPTILANKFNSLTLPLLEKMISLINENKTLKETRDLLIKKLIS